MKSYIGYFVLTLLFFYEVATENGNTIKLVNIKKAGGEGSKRKQYGLLVNANVASNSSEEKLREAHHDGHLRNAKRNGERRVSDTNEGLVETSFLSVKSRVKYDASAEDENTESEGEEVVYSDDEDGDAVMELSVDGDKENLDRGTRNTLLNQMTILKDITDKIKKENSSGKDIRKEDNVHETDAVSIADEERKIDKFYEYENKIFQEIRENKKNIYSMINEDLDVLLKPAQKEYMKVARGIKNKLLQEYEQILKEELSRE
ncbi:conserved Plasmodium protein, unknown function [Plasmodium ovale wallikeri]|uniref:Uncharacterized protein n=2 Tax=Plasmodium ovale TaxID=36330 RepID=A0A1A8Z0H4_PLAOA|nr:conserved Plasmodium protein, unknown function [Plasmodium ovale wallikeri]SBT37337.1 conserved Plasmodium protein, unknown function [Plasmodium ovale wallikeri]SBT77477.1 conserved Plasmodium protein, unknown function [Plasmodium ovale]